MDSDGVTVYPDSVKCCDCGCNCSSILNRSLSGTALRSVKRKYKEYEDEDNKFVVPGLNLPQNARVDVENECVVLREMVSNQQNTIIDLSVELEEERNAASSAANEAMSMILRLQREKAEIQMEARQFKRFAEEKMEHDLQEFLALEDLLYKREEEIQSLSCEVEMYKHRMMSFGLTEAEVNGEINGNGGVMSRNQSMSDNLDGGQFELPSSNYYPSLRINVNVNRAFSEVENEFLDVEKIADGETPHSLKDLECRINQLERSPGIIHPEGECNGGTKNMLEKVIIGQSPRRTTRHRRRFSSDMFNSCATPTESPRLGSSFKKTTVYSHPDDYYDSKKGGEDVVSDTGDDSSDRVYTVDSVYPGTTPRYGIAEPKASIGLSDDYVATPNAGDPDIQKLYARLQALEADRESMRQAIISMQTDKAQLVLLKKIAQEFFKERPPPQKEGPLRKTSFVRSFSFISVFKWIASIVFWRRKARECKYMFGFSPRNTGLLSLLDKGQPHTGQGRYRMYQEHKLSTTSFLN